MSEGRPGNRRKARWALALGVVSVVSLGVVGLMLSLRSAPNRADLVPSAPSSGSPSSAPSASSARVPARPESDPEPRWTEEDDRVHDTLAAQREALLRKLVKFQDFSPEAIEKVRAIFEKEQWLGQGNPKPTQHPMTRAECRQIRSRAKVVLGNRELCKRKHMVPIHGPQGSPSTAEVCIDQFEFPNIPCEYPVTWVRASVAQELCELQGKRLCDAHEWEGACAGAVLPPEEEYAWGIRPYEEIKERRFAMQHDHNLKREIVWAYGKEKDHKKCATGSRKNNGCVTPTWEKCGTNTYPAGAFPECVSPFGAYDLHGNAAEHMNFPMSEDKLASRGGMGQTEMKGSWFIFGMYEAHLDDCRWRAPDWHGGPVLSATSHMNYHLGFRCCRDLKPLPPQRKKPSGPTEVGSRPKSAPVTAAASSASAVASVPAAPSTRAVPSTRAAPLVSAAPPVAPPGSASTAPPTPDASARGNDEP